RHVLAALAAAPVPLPAALPDEAWPAA
ncbi:MAG: hypothetical protein JWO90_2059, partial [Solirubrobacterales bacterium]|nr:hypothetical protein [Solirubrobacterales bacterium]